MKKHSLVVILFGLGSALTLVTADLVSTRARLLEAQSTPHLNLGDPLPANLFIELAKAINPSVVNISSTHNPRRLQIRGNPNFNNSDPFFQMFEDMFQQPMMPSRPEQSLGTGFIIRPEGLILTNNHVVEGADVIKVQLSEKDKTLYTAKLIGRDQRSDLALIKIDAKKPLPAVKLGNSTDLQVGEWVAAFGNPLGLGHTTSKGIISAIGREIEDLNRFPFLQTDASINPGNSGGPLVNSKGEVIGVNTAIAAGSQGIGFAIPIDAAKPVISTLERDGSIRHGFLGIQIYPYPLSPQQAQQIGLHQLEGALIVGVIDGSPADKAGLKEYDFVTKFDGKDVPNAEALHRMIADAEVGKTYKIELIRKGKVVNLSVTTSENIGEHMQARQPKPPERKGQSVPYGFGFKVNDFSAALSEEFGLPKLKKNYPIVVEVSPESPAARAQLAPGDVIVDVNQIEVLSAGEVAKRLRNGEINSLRVLRGGYPLLLYLSPK